MLLLKMATGNTSVTVYVYKTIHALRNGFKVEIINTYILYNKVVLNIKGTYKAS